MDHCLEEAAAGAGFFFTSALVVSTAGPGFVVLGGFSRLLSMAAKFLEGASEEGLLGVRLDPARDTEPKGMGGTERVLDVSEPGVLAACLEEAVSGVFFTSALAVSSFLVESSPAKFLEGSSEEGLLVSESGALGAWEVLPAQGSQASAPQHHHLGGGFSASLFSSFKSAGCFIVFSASWSRFSSFKSAGCRVADLDDSSSTLSFFLTASEPAKGTVGVLETKEAAFLAEEGLPCSLDNSWRKLSGL